MSDFDLFGEVSQPAMPESAAAPNPVAPAGTSADLFAGEKDAMAPPSSDDNGSYVVVARRYRPQTFDQLVGQEHVQAALCGAIANNQIGHAYLFSGPRGTGKTSTARILAKALNCQDHGPRPDPCGKCDACRSITNGNSLDVIEIDAASNTGVDNIRDLRNGVVLAPFSRYKVYIVDEVHMLSMQAFNALLKTLEEPPSNVVFILATTDLQKVPETIVSRCQSFNFRRFTNKELEEHLGKIFDRELARKQATVESTDREKILRLIAQNADGGMRDAQVALDQVLVLTQDKIDYETVRRFLGAVDFDMLDHFLLAMKDRKAEELLKLIDKLVTDGQDLEMFVKSLTLFIRNLLIVRTAPNSPELLNLSPDRYDRLKAFALDLQMSFLLNASTAMLDLLERMKQASQVRFLLEVTVLRLVTVDATEDIDKLITHLDSFEKALKTSGNPFANGAAPLGNGDAPKNANAKSPADTQPTTQPPTVERKPETVRVTAPPKTGYSTTADVPKRTREETQRQHRQMMMRGKVIRNKEMFDVINKEAPQLTEVINTIKKRYQLQDDNFSIKYN